MRSLLQLIREYGKAMEMAGWHSSTADSFEGDSFQADCIRSAEKEEKKARELLKRIKQVIGE
jgi:hypothetical protein